jgi:hypothetical protein
MGNFYIGGVGADHALVPLVPSSDALLDQPKLVTNSPTNTVVAPSSDARLYQHGGCGGGGEGGGGGGGAPPICADALVPQSQNTFYHRTHSTTEHTTPPVQTLPASPEDVAHAEPVGAGTGTNSRKYVIHRLT